MAIRAWGVGGDANINNLQKAAILMIALGPELSSKVFKYLTDDEIESISMEIASMPRVEADIRDQVIDEFHTMAVAHNYIVTGGVEYARELLERALGVPKAKEIMQRLTANLQVRPFEFIRKADPAQVINYLQNEHPQTIALILAYLHPEQSALILGALPPEQQADVAKRIATMDRTSPEVIDDVERVLEQKLSSLVMGDYTVVGGVEALVQVLNNADRATERSILEDLEVSDPELAEEIKRRMFVFENIVILDDRSIQRVLREVDLNHDLPLALKAASDEVKQKIYNNISKRAAEMLRENIEYLGPVRLRDVEEAQQRIVAIIRRLEESGEIVIARGQGDEIIV